MFIGHYAAGLAATKLDKGPSLGTMFLAAQWPDLVWPIFLLAGAERVSIDPGNTVLTPLNFEYYPWSHSLLMVLVWGLLFTLIHYAGTKSLRGSVLLGMLVFSHWVLDWISHAPDLQMMPFIQMRTGLGLWNYKWPSLILETFLLVTGAFLYLKATRPKNKTGSWSLWALLVFLVAVYYLNAFGPTPPDAKAVAWTGLSQWLIVLWGYWIHGNRQ